MHAQNSRQTTLQGCALACWPAALPLLHVLVRAQHTLAVRLPQHGRAPLAALLLLAAGCLWMHCRGAEQTGCLQLAMATWDAHGRCARAAAAPPVPPPLLQQHSLDCWPQTRRPRAGMPPADAVLCPADAAQGHVIMRNIQDVEQCAHAALAAPAHLAGWQHGRRCHAFCLLPICVMPRRQLPAEDGVANHATADGHRLGAAKRALGCTSEHRAAAAAAGMRRRLRLHVLQLQARPGRAALLPVLVVQLLLVLLVLL